MPKLLLAIIVLIAGSIAINFILGTIEKIARKSKVDKTLLSFLLSFTKYGLKGILLIIVIGMLGVQMTSLIALLGAAGLAIGMALSGTLQNIAGGVVLMILRPFHVGDRIEAQ